MTYELKDFRIKARVQNTPDQPASRIDDVRLCERAIDLYNQRPGQTRIPNPYVDAPEGLRSWSFENQHPDLFFRLAALQLREIEATLVEMEGEREAQTISLRCPLPLDWQLALWEDATIDYPGALAKFAQRDPGRDGLLIDGSIAGMGFSLLPAVGYEPSFTWVLKTKTHDLEKVKEQLTAQFPFVSWSRTRVVRNSLIPADVSDPLQILAVTNSVDDYAVSRIWVKGSGFPEGEVLMPIHAAFSSHFDFSLTKPLQAMARNSQPALLAMTSVRYPEFTVEACTHGSAITDPANCLNVNRAHLYQQFAPLFALDAEGELKQAEVCTVLYFATTVSQTKGLAKIACINREGALTIRHNGLHDYFDEALAMLSAAP
jgi:hypothetical protein